MAGGTTAVHAKGGTTWYVNSGPSGNDNNTCLSRKHPCATIPGAMAKAASGDTIEIAAGTYAGGFTIAESLSLKGAKGAPPVISGGSPGVTIPGGVTATLANLQVIGATPGIADSGTLTLSGSTVIDDAGGVLDAGVLTAVGGALSSNSGNGLTVNGGADANVTGTTLASNSGTGVSNAGTMSLAGAAVSGNSAGGISNSGTGAVSTTTVTSNGNGGIINSGALTLNNSTVGSNSGGNGGVSNTGTLSMNGTTVQSNSGGQAGIYNSYRLTMTNSTISGNSGSCAGGVCNSNGAFLTVTTGTVSGNTASQMGGGIYNAGTTSLLSSSVNGNSCPGNCLGGGIYNSNGNSLVVTDSTISDNFAGTCSNYCWSTYQGGGIYNRGLSILTNTTISNNSADSPCGYNCGSASGGGVYNNGGSTAMSNTLLAGNTLGVGDTVGPDCVGTLSDGNGANSNNLIGIGDGCGLTSGQNGDQVGSSGSPINPMLGPLASNGGPTQTMALQPGSPAIGTAYAPTCLQKGSGNVNDKDQRGYPRNSKNRGVCDIGAYDTGGH
ncbi:MAG TPA: choice-of-anchor Q domain-containing protein [Chloroflexota bacterium]|nr:choice-of-anchor Q domain-containing protein [Chloroflexota bacterium]